MIRRPSPCPEPRNLAQPLHRCGVCLPYSSERNNRQSWHVEATVCKGSYGLDLQIFDGQERRPYSRAVRLTVLGREPPATLHSSKETNMRNLSCAVEGCKRSVGIQNRTGVCRPHYQQQRRLRKHPPRIVRTSCSTFGCTNHHSAKGLCKICYAKRRWVLEDREKARQRHRDRPYELKRALRRKWLDRQNGFSRLFSIHSIRKSAWQMCDLLCTDRLSWSRANNNASRSLS